MLWCPGAPRSRSWSDVCGNSFSVDPVNCLRALSLPMSGATVCSRPSQRRARSATSSRETMSTPWRSGLLRVRLKRNTPSSQCFSASSRRISTLPISATTAWHHRAFSALPRVRATRTFTCSSPPWPTICSARLRCRRASILSRKSTRMPPHEVRRCRKMMHDSASPRSSTWVSTLWMQRLLPRCMELCPRSSLTAAAMLPLQLAAVSACSSAS
mmetsp:Transcript_48436/g.112242  ORF Transcript_48436/g.112242 Transcript_48436/m.112242 type:complete len:214 (+) Transcript_48436:895-1536(+)